RCSRDRSAPLLFVPHPRPPSPPFPYTTLFRSCSVSTLRRCGANSSSDRARPSDETATSRSTSTPVRIRLPISGLLGARAMPGLRSEEHTSELQSLRHLVCRLLLEKQKPVIDTR